MSRRFEPPFYKLPPNMAIPQFIFFPEIPAFALADFFDNIAPIKYRINTKINSLAKLLIHF